MSNPTTPSQQPHEHPGGNFAAGQEALEHGTPTPGHFSEGQESMHGSDDPGHFAEGQEERHAGADMPGTFADGQRGR